MGTIGQIPVQEATKADSDRGMNKDRKETSSIFPSVKDEEDDCCYKIKKDDRHEGFARGHPPYYWPRLSTLNFLDLTG